MIFQESETVELKSIAVDEIKKEIIAITKCEGGKLYIGVQDDGTVIGVNDPDGAALQVSNEETRTKQPSFFHAIFKKIYFYRFLNFSISPVMISMASDFWLSAMAFR